MCFTTDGIYFRNLCPRHGIVSLILYELSVKIKKGNECSSPQGKVKKFELTVKNEYW